MREKNSESEVKKNFFLNINFENKKIILTKNCCFFVENKKKDLSEVKIINKFHVQLFVRKI